MDLIWFHTDTDPATTVPEMFRIAKSGAWGTINQPMRTRYIRMLVAFSLQAGLMSTAPPRPKGPEGKVEYGYYGPKLYRDIASLEVASTVLRTLQLIVPAGHYAVENVRTKDGEDPFLQGSPVQVEVGAFPLVIWVVGIAACAIASVLIAQVAGDVIDRQLTRSEDTRKLVSAQAAAVELVLKHVEHEEAKGSRIPYDEAETTVLESLLNIQRKIAEKRQKPLPTPFAGAARSLEHVVGKVGTGLEMAVPIAIAGGLLLLLWSRK